jgi:hypothetical protein
MENVICKFCDNIATHIAAQSSDAGKTVKWVPVCEADIFEWNDGGDWSAPIFKLGERIE